MNLETKLLLLICLAGLCAILTPWWAWLRLQSLEKKYGKKLLVRGINGEQAAKIILLRGEIPQVDVDETSLVFANYYAAHEPALKLSSSVYHGKRLFDIARAARLAGHALQHRDRQFGKLSSWDALITLWGNLWPVLLVLTFFARGKWIIPWAALSVVAMIMTLIHLSKHQLVRDAAQRGQMALEEARLLDGHPENEVKAAFLATRLDHLAIPFSRTWWGYLFFK